MMGNIEAIEKAYSYTKEYIVYDSFQTIMVAIVFFLSFLKFYEIYTKCAEESKQLNFSSYWSQIKVYVLVCFVAGASGSIFTMIEAVLGDLQTALVSDLGGDSSSKASDTLNWLVNSQTSLIESKTMQGLSLDNIWIVKFFWQACSGFLMGIGVFLFKYTYTFFILGRYMWLLLLELIAPIAIILIIHENTRSYFYTWLKNMIICYLLIPMFLLADCFSNEVALLFVAGKESAGTVAIFTSIAVAVWVKIKMFAIVRSRSNQLF